MEYLIIFPIVVFVCVSLLLVLTLIGIMKPTIKNVYVMACVIALWVLYAAINNVKEPDPKATQTEIRK